MICDAARKVMQQSKVKLVFEYDEPKHKPVVDDAYIRFNGVEDDGHETFVLTKHNGSDFEFCKTAQKPYDVVVTAILIVAAANGLQVTSDGGPKDWQPGLDLLIRTCGGGYKIPVEE